MELACLFVLCLLCGLSQQAPKQLTKRDNTGSTSRILEKEPNPLSIENLFTNHLNHRRQNVIELVRNITPASEEKAEQKLEKHSTIRKIPDKPLQEPNNDTKTGNYDKREKHLKTMHGSDGSGSSDDTKNGNGSDTRTIYDEYQDADQSGEEVKEDVSGEPTPSNEDSVAAFINTDSVKGTTRDIITADKMSGERDPVASYIKWNRKQERNGNIRDIIEESKSEDDSATADHDTHSDVKAVINSNRRDSVAPYISEATARERKDKISALEPNLDTDSVSSYIEVLGSQKKGFDRTNIAINNKNNDENEGPVGEDSGAPYQVNDRKDIKSKKLEQHNSEKESMRNNLSDIAKGASGSGEDVVDDDDNAVDSDVSETIGGDSSGAQDEAIGEEKLHSSKAQAILESLEEGLSQESSSSGFEEKLAYKDDQNEELSHLKKTQEHSAPYVVQQPYGVPIQYNMPQYTVPQYTYVSIKDAENKGAVCLDGSTPGYFYRRGAGNGERKWIIYLQGGAWCDSKEDCYERSESNLGSSLRFAYLKNAEGLLSRNEAKNPDFYNWNVVYVPYCDGASYTGNRSHPVVVKGRRIYFRGKRILSALLDDLLVHGLSHSEKVVFSGTSAGGLAVFLNADYIRSRIPTKVKVYSLADAGVFLDVNDLKGKSRFADSMKAVYELHHSSGSINPKCRTHQGKKSAWKCLFPYYFGEYIQSPLFIVNPLHDSWQLANVVGIHCAYKPDRCDKKEMKAIKTFREQTLKALNPFMKNPHVGIFADGCVDHGQIVFSSKWTKIRVKNRSMSGTFARWLNREENVKSVIDLQADQYPFNPTCSTL